jgi:putative transposase
MARLPRLSIVGCPQHIIQLGNNRQAYFFAEQDYTVYLDKLKNPATEHNVNTKWNPIPLSPSKLTAQSRE